MKQTTRIHSTGSTKRLVNGRLPLLMISLLLTAVLGVGCKGRDSSPQSNPPETETENSGKNSTEGTGTDSDKESDGQVSAGAQKIIETFMNCPNSDYYDYDNVTVIGLGTDDEETKASIEKARDVEKQLFENWEQAVGAYFSPNCLESFFSSNARYYFDHYAGKTVEVQDMELVEKTDTLEIVRVTILADGNPREELIRFRKNSDGTIWQVGIWLEEYSDYI